MAYCCVPLCKSRFVKGGDISFHEIPVDENLRKMWLKAICRKDWSPNTTSNYTRVCSKHFLSSDYRKTNKFKCLSNTAVPSQFPNYPQYLQPVIKKAKISFPAKKRNTHDETQAVICNNSKVNHSENPAIGDIVNSDSALSKYESTSEINHSQNPEIDDKISSCSSSNKCEVKSEINHTRNPPILIQVSSASNKCDKNIQVDVIYCEKRVQLKNLKQRDKRKAEKIQQLQEQLNEVQEKLNSLESNPYVQSIFKILNAAENCDAKAVFLKDLVNNFERKKPMYEEYTIRQCLLWRNVSTRGYEYARENVLNLPSRTTVAREDAKIRMRNADLVVSDEELNSCINEEMESGEEI